MATAAFSESYAARISMKIFRICEFRVSMWIMTSLLGCYSCSTLGSRANDYAGVLTASFDLLPRMTNNTLAAQLLSPKYFFPETAIWINCCHIHPSIPNIYSVNAGVDFRKSIIYQRRHLVYVRKHRFWFLWWWHRIEMQKSYCLRYNSSRWLRLLLKPTLHYLIITIVQTLSEDIELIKMPVRYNLSSV